MIDGKFYLGKELPGLKEKFLYKSEDLTTHAIVFGMTGSGKTGLCIDIIEEAVSEDIPIIIIDPKGDVSNIALMFPDLLPENFLPWISATEAKKSGLTMNEYSKVVAEKWKNGLEKWGISTEKIRDIRSKMDLRIFTPGSSEGMQISILEGFSKPEGRFTDNEEMNIQKIKNSVSALLALLDIDNDPLKSKPHILISNIIEHFWRNDISLSIEDLILNIQKPPIKKLGVFDIDRIIDKKEREELAFEINNIIASSSFRFWKNGMPVSAKKLYEKRDGKIPINIFYTSHLPENEKMFFSSLLLNEIVYWIKKQPGTTDLKYMLYMDEIYGYLPPYPKNPPSKNPMMILMKQARAFGLGVVLVTQNPKDIDYKALTNTGTWFIGKLQAEGDRERVMEGLSGAVNQSGEELEKKDIEDKITNLKKREFLVKNVHRKGVKSFYTRWAMSYLCGPLTTTQIGRLMKQSDIQIQKSRSLNTDHQSEKRIDKKSLPPVPETPLKYFYDNSGNAVGKYYRPYFFIEAELIFDDHKYNLFLRKKYNITFPLKEKIDWETLEISENIPEYSEIPDKRAEGFKDIPIRLTFSNIKKFDISVKNSLFRNLSVKLFINRDLKLVSKEGQDRDSFNTECRTVVEKMIDKEIEKRKDSFEKKIRRIEDRIEREKQRIETLEDVHKSKKTEEIISIGETILGFLLGSKSRRGFSTAARKRRMTAASKDRIETEKVKLSQFENELVSLKEEMEDEVANIEDKFYDKSDNIEDFNIRLEKEDIIVVDQSILWRLSE